jgi:LysR family positive regulator for ilvC
LEVDLHSLKLFLHLAGSLHFLKTSQACNISPPGLTRAIQRLEDEVGEKLFERNNRSVSLTPAGEVLRRYAGEILDTWAAYRDARASHQGGVYGELYLYCSVTASYLILKEFLSAYRRAYPQVRINLQTGEAETAVKQVAEGNVDIAIAARPDTVSPRIEFKSVTATPLVFIAGVEFRPGADFGFESDGGADFALESVGGSPFILPAHGLSRKRADEWFALKKTAPRIYAEVSGNEAIIAMASLGLGIGIVPLLVLDQSPLKDDVKILPLEPELRGYDVGYCRLRRKNHKTAVEAFWNMIGPRGDFGLPE